MELFIPTRIQKDAVFGKGFGKKEMKRTVIAAIFGLIFGLSVGMLFYNDNFQTILVATVVVALIITASAYFISVKNSINLSVYDYIQLVKIFFKTQQFYKYRKLKEWF